MKKIFALFLLLCSAPLFALQLTAPKAAAKARALAQADAPEDAPVYQVRAGSLEVYTQAIDELRKLANAKPDEYPQIELSLFENISFTLIPQAIKISPSGILTISGKLKDIDFGTGIIAINSKNILNATFSDKKNNLEYNIVCDGTNNVQTVLEFDAAKMPKFKDGESKLPKEAPQ